jgi:hypothetical protein
MKQRLTAIDASLSDPGSKFRTLKRGLLIFNVVVAVLAGWAAGHAATASPDSALLTVVREASNILPLDRWAAMSSHKEATKAYMLFSLPLALGTFAWFFALLYLPPSGGLGEPYTVGKRFLGLLMGVVCALLAYGVPALEQGQDVSMLPVGTSLPHLVLFGWYSAASFGLFCAAGCVLFWKGLTGR